MCQLCFHGLASALRQSLLVALMQGNDVILLLEAELPYPVGGIGKCFLVGLLQADLVLVATFERRDALVGIGECSLELRDGGRCGFFDSCLTSVPASVLQSIKTA